MRLIALLALLLPAVASAVPADVAASWNPVDRAATYSLACGLAPDALSEIATSTTTTATGPVDLPTDSGTLYCTVTAITESGLMSQPSGQLEGVWDITEVPPEPPVLIEIGVQIDCPEGFECVVSVSP